MSAGSVRAFFSVEVPVNALNFVGMGWLGAGYLRRVREDQRHITPAFLGDVSVGKIDALMGAISNFSFNKFMVHVKGTGMFSGSAKVIYADVTEGRAELEDMSTRLRSMAGSLGIRVERREFVPHITLARVKDLKHEDEVLAHVMESADHEFGYFECSSVKLKKSVLKPEGPEYTDMFTVSASP